MTSEKYLPMLVCWKQQRRFINLKSDDNLNSIEKSIINIYHLQQSIKFNEYQIQYYDQFYQTFIDLTLETISRFQQLVQELLLSKTTLKTGKIWRLKIIPKAIETMHHKPRDTNNDQEQDSINNQIDDRVCDNHTTEDSHEIESSQIETEDQQGTNQVTVLNSDSQLNFHFEYNIADHQRGQYESEIRPRNRSNNSSIGVVFLRAPNLNGTSPHPILQFQIPETKRNLSWSLYLYILTEWDSNENYYLHASKGIYDNITTLGNKFGPIQNSDLVNPYVIDLSPNDIQQGKYEILVRVCNIRNLPTHRHTKLRKFPELNYYMIYDDTNLISEYTSDDLNFSSGKYHLGCILVCNNTVQDRCISRLTTDDNKRKRK